MLLAATLALLPGAPAAPGPREPPAPPVPCAEAQGATQKDGRRKFSIWRTPLSSRRTRIDARENYPKTAPFLHVIAIVSYRELLPHSVRCSVRKSVAKARHSVCHQIGTGRIAVLWPICVSLSNNDPILCRLALPSPRALAWIL